MRSHFPRTRGQTTASYCLPRLRGSGCAALAAADEGGGADVTNCSDIAMMSTIANLESVRMKSTALSFAVALFVATTGASH